MAKNKDFAFNPSGLSRSYQWDLSPWQPPQGIAPPLPNNQPLNPSYPNPPLEEKPYLPGSVYDASYSSGDLELDLSPKRWRQELERQQNLRWRDTPQGRLGIRMFARGVLGASAFAIGGRYFGEGLAEYHPDKEAKNIPSMLAKFTDKTFGKGVKKAFNTLGMDGEKLTHFRETRFNAATGEQGWSLGHEMWHVTGGFYVMSIGDATGRDLADVMDSRYHNSWRRDDDSIDYTQMLKSAALSAGRYVTYNGGEDVAIALPYIYVLRGLRGGLNKAYPGFIYDIEAGMNGGSFRVAEEAELTGLNALQANAGMVSTSHTHNSSTQQVPAVSGKLHRVGDYMTPGMIYTQFAYSIYNIGTGMFRETYSTALDQLLEWREKNYAIPTFAKSPGNLLQAAKDAAKYTVRWAARDVIKASIYMAPTSPMFWLMYTPGSKYAGYSIHEKNGVVAYEAPLAAGASRFDFVHAHELRRGTNKLRQKEFGFSFTPETPTYYRKYTPGHGWETTGKAPNPLAQGEFDVYDQNFGGLDPIYNTIGRGVNNVRKTLHSPLRKSAEALGYDVEANRLKRVTDKIALASLSYTPYFYMKTEYARLWDNGRTDISIERMLDGASGFNWKEFKAGTRDLWYSLNQKALPEPEREALARYRIATDASPADVFNPRIFEPGGYNSLISSSPHFQQAARYKHFMEIDEADKQADEQQQTPSTTTFAQRVSKPLDDVRSRTENSVAGIVSRGGSYQDAVAKKQLASQQKNVLPEHHTLQ